MKSNDITQKKSKIEGETKIPKLSAANYKTAFQIDNLVFKKMIDWALFKGEQDAHIAITKGIVFDFHRDKLLLAGSNGQKIAVCAEPVNTDNAKRFSTAAKILFDIAEKLEGSGSITVYIGTRAAVFKKEGEKVYAPFEDCGFEDYKKVVPKDLFSENMIRWYIRRPVK